MSILNSLYGVIIEVALWLFVSQVLSMVAPLLALVGYVSLILWRFGFSGLKSVFGFRSALSVPSLFLLASAGWQFKHSFQSLIAQSAKFFLIPLQEELLYRYILPKTVKKYFPARFLSVVVSAILFCVAHRASFSAADFAVCFVTGITLGIRTERRSGSIVEPFIIHALHNLHVLNTASLPQSASPGSFVSEGVKRIVGPITFYTAVLGYDLFKLFR